MITLYRSSNAPIIFSFDIDIESIPEMELSLYSDINYTRLIQRWTKDDVIISGKYLVVPLKQSETLKFPVGIGHLELKWLDISGFVLFTRSQSILIKTLSNLNIMGQDSQIDYDNLDIEALLSAETLNKYHTTSIITNIATINTCECGLDGALSEPEILEVLQ